MHAMPEGVHGGPEQPAVSQVREVRDGWRCPVCHWVMAPGVPTCMHCKPIASKVPRHIYNALVAELMHARSLAAPGQRIIRGTFCLHYIEVILDAIIAHTGAEDIHHDNQRNPQA